LILCATWLVAFSACPFAPTKDAATTQRIPIIVREEAFEPAEVSLAEGVPAVLEFTRVAESGCTSAVKMPWMEEAVDLPLNEVVEIAVDPSMTEDFSYSCWMDMVHGKVAFVPADSGDTPGDESAKTAARAQVDTPAVVHAAARATSIDPPAAPGSTDLALTVERDRILGQDFILMTWIEPDGDDHLRLRFARFTEHSWSSPFTVARGVSASTEDPPSLAIVDTDTGRSTLLARAGNLAARSTDRGRIWLRLPAPDLEFASLAGAYEEVHAFGLSAGLNGSALLWGGPAFAERMVLDPHVSERSATSAAATSDGPVVVYRDRSEDDVRDIAIVRYEEDGSSEPHLVHADGWRLSESPPHAPAVAAKSRKVVVAWYTEALRRPRLLVAFSSDSGDTFGEPVEVDRPLGIRAPSGAVSVAIDEDGGAIVLWVATNRAGEADLLLSRVAADGRRGDELLVARMPATRLRGVPRMARASEQLAVAWEEGGSSAGVRAVSIPVDAIQPPTDAEPPADRAARARIGELAPSLVITSLSGEKVSLDSLRGRPVLLNVWATWCLPCLEEIPELVKLHDRHGPEGLAVVGVSVDVGSAVDHVRSFVAQHEIPFAIWLDPDERVSQAFGVRGVPATFVLDREGRVLLRREGPITVEDAEFAQALERARG
jgi:peroxiredoxin